MILNWLVEVAEISIKVASVYFLLFTQEELVNGFCEFGIFLFAE